MPAKQRQPSYYEKKYFDEKFDHVVCEIKEVKVEVKRMNGDLSAIKKEQIRVVIAQKQKMPIFDQTVKTVKKLEKKYIYVSGFATGAGTLVGYIVSNLLR